MSNIFLHILQNAVISSHLFMFWIEKYLQSPGDIYLHLMGLRFFGNTRNSTVKLLDQNH